MSTERTDRWGFSILGPGDSIADDGFKFSDADRRLMDRLLQYAAELHHHTGEAGSDNTPAGPPSLSLSTTGGAMAAGRRFFYQVTVINPDGFESAGSPVSFVDTPSPLNEPSAPALSYVSGVGSLDPGQYIYVLSAYKTLNVLETKAINTAVISVLGTQTATVTLTMPSLPAGADGFNVYRKSPNGLHFLYIASTSAASWDDNGTIDGDCDRGIPVNNRSNNENYVTVTYPGATPAIPDGWSWRIYRSDDANDWANTFLTELTPFGSPLHTLVSYDDIGGATSVGSPPIASQIISAPDPIQLNNAAEVQGFLPPGRNVEPYQIEFVIPGVVTAHEGTWTWTCDFDEADILLGRAYLGRGSVPASQDIIVDINAFRPGEATASWQSIYDENQTIMPHVPIGETIGATAAPIWHHLVQGDQLSVDVDQTGGGATPTDYDLTVNVLMLVKRGSETTSYEWISE